MSTNRRTFLTQLSTAAVGSSLLHGMLSVREAFAAEVERAATVDGVWAVLRDRYMLGPGVRYLNHASMGTMPRAVHEARQRYLETVETNPWRFMWSGEWDPPREDVRAQGAALIGCQPHELALTHNTTEGFNILAHGLPLGPGDEIVFSSLNHPGASVCWHHMAAVRGFTVRPFDFPVLDVPGMSADDVLGVYDRHITPRTKVLVFPHIDNIVGLRYPVKKLAALAHDRGVEFVAVDGAQAVGMIPVDVSDLGVDLYAASPHKWLQAPKGLGLLYVREQIQSALRPMWVTWGQEREGWKGTARIYEDYGTRNLAEVLTLGHAMAFQTALGEGEKLRRYQELRRAFAERVEAASDLVWRSPLQPELSSAVMAVEVRGQESGAVFVRMYEEHGFVFRSFRTQGLNTIRLSPNVYTSDEEVETFFRFVLG